MKSRGFGASVEQRHKVAGLGCRVCGQGPVDPAHCVPRARGGCDDPLCVIPLCRTHHREYDTRALDVLPMLTKDEQAHAVSHVGLVSALERTTNERWSPRLEAA